MRSHRVHHVLPARSRSVVDRCNFVAGLQARTFPDAAGDQVADDGRKRRLLARKAERQFGNLGPFSAEEIGALISSAFIGAESLYLLGAEQKGVPVRLALRRFGDVSRSAESQSPGR